MAEIFRGKAVAAGGFEKPVAIKRILPHLSQDSRFVQLLIAEAKVLSLLKHRNIVQIFDVGLGDDGQYFLVMEYVDGKDLGGVQRGNEAARRRIPFDLALHIGAEVCEALEHAHSSRGPDGKPMSLVHRDLSPSNVLLSRAGEVKLTDFGIAKRAESEQTGSGAVRGKFAYISPEQARNEHVEPRSDVFSVGILLWEMVTGQRLFSKLGDLEALRMVREPNVQPPTSVDPRLHKGVDALLLAALSKDPKRRPTAGQLGEQLRSLRYSLDEVGGDPGTELGKMIEGAEEVERESSQSMTAMTAPPRAKPKASGFEAEGTEATVIRIRTAAEFNLLDAASSMSSARAVIDRFDEQETKLAQLSGDQLRRLRETRDSSEMDASDATIADGMGASPIPHGAFESDEATKLVAPISRRTPPPERVKPKSIAPPLPGMTNARAAGGPSLPGLPANRSAAARPRAASVPPPAPRAPSVAPPPMPDAALLEQPSYSAPGTVHNRYPTGVPHPPATNPAPHAPMTLTESAPVVMPNTNAPLTLDDSPLPTQPRAPTADAPNLYAQPGMAPMNRAISQPMQNLPPPMSQPGPMPMGLPSPPMSQPGLRPSMQQPNWGPPPQRPMTHAKRSAIQPWMLVLGALVMAAVAFLVTRALMHR
jgi:serine/threonine-protein kinase